MKIVLLKTLFRFYLLAMVIGSSFWLTSCDDDDENELKDASPEVSFTNLTADQVVWNTVSISLEASDDKGIGKIDLFIGGDLIASVTEAPFEISWDSNTVPDGSHIVKVVATDEAGNTVEREIVIIVRNTLLTIDIKSNQLGTGADEELGLIFLSDADGKLITSAQYSNGQHLELKAPGFNGDKFFVTEVFISFDPDYIYPIHLYTFPEVERGKWVVVDNVEEDGYAGNATLNFSNPTAGFVYAVQSNGEGIDASELQPSATIGIRKSPSKLYVIGFEGDGIPTPKFNLYSNIVVGQNAINLALVDKALTKITATVPDDATDSRVEVLGYPVANNYTEPYHLGWNTGSPGKIDIYYPGTAFPSYYINQYYESPEVYFSRGSRTDFGNFTSPQHTEQFAFANNKLTYSASGNYDFAFTSYNDEDQFAEWTFMLPKGSNLTVPKLEMPELFDGFEIPFGMPSSYGILEVENIDGYDGLKTFIRNSSHSIDELGLQGQNYTNVTFYSIPTGGRVKRGASMTGPGIRLKKRK